LGGRVDLLPAHRAGLGCTIAPATYYEHRSRRPCAQEQRGADLKPLITKVHDGDLGQCGVDAGDQQIDD